jgi:hypothetical protein
MVQKESPEKMIWTAATAIICSAKLVLMGSHAL